MPNLCKPANLFSVVYSSLDVIQLLVLMYVRFPSACRTLTTRCSSRVSTSARRRCGFGERGLCRCSQVKSGASEFAACAVHRRLHDSKVHEQVNGNWSMGGGTSITSVRCWTASPPRRQFSPGSCAERVADCDRPSGIMFCQYYSKVLPC